MDEIKENFLKDKEEFKEYTCLVAWSEESRKSGHPLRGGEVRIGSRA